MKRSQKKGGKEEEKFKSLIESAPDDFFQLDAQGNITNVNSTAAELTGYSRTELLKMNMSDLIPGSLVGDKPLNYDLLKQGETIIGETEVRTKAGKYIHVEMVLNAMPDGACQSFIRDMSGRTQAEEKLRELLQRQQVLLAAIPDIIMEVDFNKIYTWANKAGLEFFGNDVIGKEAAYYFEGEQNTYAVVEPVFKGSEDIFYVESWQRRKDGQKRLLAWWCHSLKDPSGNVTGALSSARDITGQKQAEEAIQTAAAQWQRTFNAVSDGICLLDKAQRIVRCNDIMKTIIPERSEELKGKQCWEIVHGTTGAIKGCPYRRMIKTLQREKMELNLNDRWYEITVDPILDAKNKLTGAVHIMRDITESRKAIEAISQSESNFRDLFEHSPEGKSKTGLDGSVYVNQSLCNILGYSEEEMNTKKWADFTHPDDIALTNDYIRQLTDGKIKRARFEKRFFHKNGNIVWADVSSYLQRDKEGKPQFLITTISDITERKRMEEKIIESEAYYRTLVDLSPDGIFIVDREGNISYGSQKMYELLSIPREEDVLGSSVLNWISPDYHEIVTQRMKDIFSGDFIPAIREYKLLKYDKTPFWAELSSSPIKDVKGNPGGLLVVCRDVTERKKAGDELIRAKEKAEESDRLKTAFLHNISHEIRTPLNAIVGFSSFLDQPDLAEEDRKKFIDIISQSNNQLLSIVNDILNISHIEAGLVKIKESATDLNQVMNNLYNQFLPEAYKKNLVLKTETTQTGSDALVITDESKMIQILTNLLNNAFKFTHNGQIKLGYKIEGDLLVVYVEDTGIGIPEHEQAKIFERFYQIDSKQARIYGGTGLGLSISAAYARLLGGEITIRSTKGKGSIFYLSIPYKKPEVIEQPEKIQVPDQKPDKDGKKRILIAEDEESNFNLLIAMLKSENYELVFARNGLEAVEFCKSDPDISLIIMDIKMPFMDGFDATREILNIRPWMPIIAQTAFAHSSDRIKALEHGCVDYISKPFSKVQLLDLLKKY